MREKPVAQFSTALLKLFPVAKFTIVVTETGQREVSAQIGDRGRAFSACTELSAISIR